MSRRSAPSLDTRLTLDMAYGEYALFVHWLSALSTDFLSASALADLSAKEQEIVLTTMTLARVYRDRFMALLPEDLQAQGLPPLELIAEALGVPEESDADPAPVTVATPDQGWPASPSRRVH